MRTFSSFSLLSGLLLLSACATPATEPEVMDHTTMNMDHSGMTMDEMVAVLEGKTGDAFDKAFIEAMIPHHQGAIDMAAEVLQSAEHQELKDMAYDIITAQQTEIDQMKQWYSDWGYGTLE